jgi:very-short-patch-repair endonuclease
MNIHPKNVLRAKELRKNMSESEKVFWHAIRDNKTGFQFRRQYKIGKYYADFVCIEKRLIIELDGNQHCTDTALRYDSERTDFFKSHAWRIIRIPNGYIYRDLENVIFCLKAMLNSEAEIKEINIFTEKYDMEPNKDWTVPILK